MVFRGLSWSAKHPVNLRAAAGGLLVTLALLGVSQAYAHADAPPATRYVVALGTVAPGEVLGPEVLATVAADLPASLARRAFRDPVALDGAVALAPLEAGDLVLASHVRPEGGPPAGTADVSFTLPTDRAVAGDLQPGEWVDLVATDEGGGRTARLAASDALVVAVANADDGLLATGAGLVLTVRLADRSTALRVVQAVDQGHVTVVRPS
jgi:SAF domain